MGCRICGEQQFRIRAQFASVRYLECVVCGVVYQDPIPEQSVVEDMYGQDNSGYFVSDTKSANHLEGEEWLRETARFFISRIQPRVGKPLKGLRHLDFGCGTGILLDELQQRGADVVGVEASPWACRYARERFGLTMHNEDIMTVNLPPASFDLITMSHVIEHLPDPLVIVRRIAQFLKPGGVLMIATPHANSLGANLFGSKWLYYLPNEHLHLFSHRSITSVVEQSGLQLLEVETYLWRKRSTISALARTAFSLVRTTLGGATQFVTPKDGIITFAQKLLS